MAGNTSNRGLANADEKTKTRVAKMGNEAQSREDKAKGGHNSHKGSTNS
jgi:hypothetical protein